ncbi:MAG TPA: DUF4838 domain-containing protein, partial [Chitinophagales bacterium]|nr:DUF4838 domain-containing protein [Chitinophagales bacterium]
GNHYLVIGAFSKQGLINGIYSYLDTLGFRWYQPGDAWTYTPRLKDCRLKLDEVLKPDFALRSFFGTYGTPRNPVVDPTKEVDKQWQTWYMRNRFGGAYILKGHSWNDFLWHNFSPLNDHRECMALVNGERVKPNTAAKFCVTDTMLQRLFVNEMVAQLEKNMKANPNASAWCVSVEPSDGGGFCECPNCQKLGCISNQVFYLANVVAKAFQKISAKAYVNLYAYNSHASPPGFALEPNVIVQIIPYGYQHYSSPQEMIADWKKKNVKLFIYDYYGIPLENVDMPLKGDLKPLEFSKRLRYWHEQHIMGATLESSYSIGCTGPGLYVFSRLGWNINYDAGKLLDDYYNRCYGKAATAVRRSQELLSADTLNAKCSLNCAIEELHKGTSKLRLDSTQNTCLTYYKAYLHYLRLLYVVKNNGGSVEPLATDSLMRYTYGIFQTMMVHQFPISEYVKEHGAATSYVKQYWDADKPKTPGMKFAEVLQLTEEQINAAFDTDVKEIIKQ